MIRFGIECFLNACLHSLPVKHPGEQWWGLEAIVDFFIIVEVPYLSQQIIRHLQYIPTCMKILFGPGSYGSCSASNYMSI